MARISRKHQKIFALNSGNNGVFGSAADNTKVLSDDLDELQEKPAFLTGWISAVLGIKKFPALEEFQSLNYINTYQLAYLFQEGIPEYLAAATYYQNSIVRKTGTYELYGSITDDNTGNALPASGADNDDWEFLQDLSATVGDATTAAKGIAMLATLTDVRANNTTKIVTPDLLTAYGFRTGDWKGTTTSTLQAGWVWAAGTIGNASSNASSRANADTLELFTLYWNDAAYNYTGTNATGAALQVYTSAGAAVAKGASAAADFAANRQIAVPDFRDRVPAGRGNMVGNAGRLSGQPGGVNGNALGASGGAETHTLIEAELPTVNLSNKSAALDGGSGGLVDGTRDETDKVDRVLPFGDDQPHNNVQPTIICNIIIKL